MTNPTENLTFDCYKVFHVMETFSAFYICRICYRQKLTFWKKVTMLHLLH